MSFSNGLNDEFDNETLLKSFGKSISVIITKFYIKNNLGFDFLIICGPKCRNFPFDVITEIYKINSNIGSVKVTVENSYYDIDSEENEIKYMLGRSTIIFLPNEKNFEKINERIDYDFCEDYKKFQHLIVFENVQNIKYNPLFEPYHMYFLSEPVNYQVHLYKVYNQLKLFSVEKFLKENCGFKMNQINEFSMKNQTWSRENFEVIETKQLNGCNISVEMIYDDKNDSMSHSNFKKRLLAELSTKMNFKIQSILKVDKFLVNYDKYYNTHGRIDYYMKFDIDNPALGSYMTYTTEKFAILVHCHRVITRKNLKLFFYV
jgi:hypothetical protein